MLKHIFFTTNILILCNILHISLEYVSSIGQMDKEIFLPELLLYLYMFNPPTPR